VNGAEDARSDWARWAVIRESLRGWWFSPSWGMHPVRHHRLATAHRLQPSPACWPATLAGNGLGDGAGGGAPASGSAGGF